MNYVLMHTPPCNYLVYHVLMLIEFLQLIFLTFYGWPIKNGFEDLSEVTISVDKYLPKLLS